MKTKEQILAWLDKQPWKNEFYENCFKAYTSIWELTFDEDLVISSFDWGSTSQGDEVWRKRSEDYKKWYDSYGYDKPMSWDEYCEQNPIREDEYFIDSDSQIINHGTIGNRYPERDSNVMSKELCEAFVAYMRLIKLRNAWVKGETADMCYKIVSFNNIVSIVSEDYHANGLSFHVKSLAKEFQKTFKDLLEVAKPLL